MAMMAMPVAQPRVFVSYSRTDVDFVKRIVDAIRGDVETWLDLDEVQIGDNWVDKLDDALSEADYLLLVLSKASVESPWVQREWTSRIGLAPIIPLLKEDCEIPALLRAIQYVDFRKSFDTGIDRLLTFFRRNRDALDPDRRVRGGDDGGDCPTTLRKLANPELRQRIAGRMSLKELEIVWFDVFQTRMGDEIPNAPIGNAALELVFRAEQRRKRDVLVGTLCRERVDLAEA
jgi:hypothetical protein